MKISIVTPSFNQVSYIKETISSIVNQGYSDLEYLIVDGGSSDGSADVISNFKDKLAYWCSEPDAGQSNAIMKGFSKCTGELFAWVNSDDVLFPNCLRLVAEYYLKNDKPDIITANIAYIDARSEIKRFIRVPQPSQYFFERGVWNSTQPCVFYRRDLFRELGGLNTNYHLSMDVDLWARCMKAGARCIHIPVYLGGFRWHHSAKTVISMRSRHKKENLETAKILNANLNDSSLVSREMWRFVMKVYRTINLHYLMAYVDYKQIYPSCHWHEYVKSQHFLNQLVALK